MRRVTGASLIEAVVAAVLFMTVFAAVMELMPRLTVRDDDALRIAEAEYRTGQVSKKYATDVWPCGKYTEPYDWGEITVQITPYRDFTDIRLLNISATIDGSRKRIELNRLIECD